MGSQHHSIQICASPGRDRIVFFFWRSATYSFLVHAMTVSGRAQLTGCTAGYVGVSTFGAQWRNQMISRSPGEPPWTPLALCRQDLLVAQLVAQLVFRGQDDTEFASKKKK